MREVRCPQCDEPQPGDTAACAHCGYTFEVSETSTTVRLARPRLFKLPHFFSIGNSNDTLPLHEHHNAPDTGNGTNRVDGIDDGETVKLGRKSSTALIDAPEREESEDFDDDEGTLPMIPMARDHDEHGHGEGSALVDEATLPLADDVHERLTGTDDEIFITQGGTWHKILEARPLRPTTTPRPRMLTPHPPVIVNPTPTQRLRPATKQQAAHKKRRQIPPALFFWLSMLVIAAMVMGGLFGIVVTFGHGIAHQTPPQNSVLTLQVSPATVDLGTMITLRGSHFSPNGRIGLTRDATIPVSDTGGNDVINANASGAFTDTVRVTPDWRAGTHTLHAEDATLHKIASFTLQVQGQSASLRPPHLLLSSSSLDLGTGDQATNSMKPVTLSNTGGGQIAWQATTTQSWLMVSPQGGTFAAGQRPQVMVAVERANLKPGSYSAKVIFTASTGQVELPVTMKTTLLVPGNASVLQLTPPVQSFTGSDGGSSPPAQVVTVSNPGQQPLQWSATTSGGNGWLSVSSTSGFVGVRSSQPVEINVNISTLLPGTYSAFVNFSGVFDEGTTATKDSPQSIYLSLTIAPQCALQILPGNLSFADVYQQPGPSAKQLNLGTTQECGSPLHWSAAVTTAGGGQWLTINTASGTTPAAPAVGVYPSNLQPGVYLGLIVFSSTAGTQTLAVTLTIAPPATPVMTTSPSTLSMSIIAGSTTPTEQTINLTNTGGGAPGWNATATTSIGGNWLTVSPANGTLTAQQSATLTVSATWQTGMTPGNYTGTITIIGSDNARQTVTGSPQTIPVNLTVLPPCTIAVTPSALSFVGVSGQPDPAAQNATISASGTCMHALIWTASSNSAWLWASPSSGSVRLKSGATTAIGVTLSGLSPQTYTGTITVTATDSVTHHAIGAPQTVTVTLTVQPPCTLQAPSVTNESFSAEQGTSPATQRFTIGVTGTCSGSAIVTPTATGGSWLVVSPASASIASGDSVTFTVTVTSSSLPADQYRGSISIAAVDGGIAIVNSPQMVAITLNVLAPPVLAVTPASLTFNVSTGTSALPFTIGNSGGEPLNWTAALNAGAPGFVSLSATSGAGLGGGANTSVNVIVDASGLSGGSTYNATVTITATDPITGNTVNGSPATVAITINVTNFSMQLSTDTLSFTTTAGTDPPPQYITLSNSGGSGSWSAGAPSQSWLSLSPTGGTLPSGGNATLTFNVDVTGMGAGGPYSATVTIAPSAGNPTTVTTYLTINSNAIPPTPTPTSGTPQITPTADIPPQSA